MRQVWKGNQITSLVSGQSKSPSGGLVAGRNWGFMATKWTTWRQVEAFIAKHELPYRVDRNCGIRLVDTFTDQRVAYTPHEAQELIF